MIDSGFDLMGYIDTVLSDIASVSHYVNRLFLFSVFIFMALFAVCVSIGFVICGLQELFKRCSSHCKRKKHNQNIEVTDCEEK